VSLQNKTLDRYRQFFPQDTFREVSARTGIQITRIYRLFHGKSMKVSELEIFDDVIQKKIADNPSFAQMNQVIEEASAILTNDELSKLTEYVSRRIKARSYSRIYISSYQNAIIA